MKAVNRFLSVKKVERQLDLFMLNFMDVFILIFWQIFLDLLFLMNISTKGMEKNLCQQQKNGQKKKTCLRFV